MYIRIIGAEIQLVVEEAHQPVPNVQTESRHYYVMFFAVPASFRRTTTTAFRSHYPCLPKCPTLDTKQQHDS